MKLQMVYKIKKKLFAYEKIAFNKPNWSDYSLQYSHMAVTTLYTSNKLIEKHKAYIQHSLVCLWKVEDVLEPHSLVTVLNH